MRPLTHQEKISLLITRKAVSDIIASTPDWLHGDALEVAMLERLTQAHAMRDAQDAALVALAALALVRLVELERGEREVAA
jgi:hypothetical protein